MLRKVLWAKALVDVYLWLGLDLRQGGGQGWDTTFLSIPSLNFEN